MLSGQRFHKHELVTRTGICHLHTNKRIRTSGKVAKCHREDTLAGNNYVGDNDDDEVKDEDDERKDGEEQKCNIDLIGLQVDVMLIM